MTLLIATKRPSLIAERQCFNWKNIHLLAVGTVAGLEVVVVGLVLGSDNQSKIKLSTVNTCTCTCSSYKQVQ